MHAAIDSTTTIRSIKDESVFFGGVLYNRNSCGGVAGSVCSHVLFSESCCCKPSQIGCKLEALYFDFTGSVLDDPLHDTRLRSMEEFRENGIDCSLKDVLNTPERDNGRATVAIPTDRKGISVPHNRSATTRCSNPLDNHRSSGIGTKNMNHINGNTQLSLLETSLSLEKMKLEETWNIYQNNISNNNNCIDIDSPPHIRYTETKDFPNHFIPISASCTPLETYINFKEQRKKKKSLKNNFCVFCKNNGENAVLYSGHVLKDELGRVSCPVLRSYTCPLCGSSGDRAHTVRYCPVGAYSAVCTTNSMGTRTVNGPSTSPADSNKYLNSNHYN
ncbi:uncharacterized protein LOC106867802 [Octopus bimaculoides]|uniref:Nanos-type domain-containing protein n=1 Tax=Octopus bimaculoides TaxID=37653 RepID=A0A0L8HYH3_OCTBM|nr:uncharacterized protein LOC106867802 [Octopus bimaculoides]|eukprot:XP_014768290.1 PREDICTED: uncharacterized protein LOC106867802 [Octopus bimaculoides]